MKVKIAIELSKEEIVEAVKDYMAKKIPQQVPPVDLKVELVYSPEGQITSAKVEF